MVPSTRHTRPVTHSMACLASGTNSASNALTTGTSVVTIRETVDWETPSKSPRNSSVPLCRRYIHAISTARYNPHACRAADLLIPRRGQGDRHAGDKFLHLRQHQPCSTLIPQRSFLGPILASVVKDQISPGKAVALCDTPNFIKPSSGGASPKDTQSFSEPLLN